jgi:hypothetical protein
MQQAGVAATTTSPLEPRGRRLAVRRFATAVAAVGALGLAAGCQSLVASGLPGLAGTHEQRLVRMAQEDSFPSPADVGISADR